MNLMTNQHVGAGTQELPGADTAMRLLQNLPVEKGTRRNLQKSNPAVNSPGRQSEGPYPEPTVEVALVPQVQSAQTRE